MKRFHFRLERVLHYLHQQEMLQSMEVAVVERTLFTLREERAVTIERKAATDEKIRREHSNVPHEELGRLYAHGEYLLRAIGLVDAQIATVQLQLEEQREILLTMSKKRKTVEELRTRRQDVYQDEVLRLEIARVDEVNERRRPMAAPINEERS